MKEIWKPVIDFNDYLISNFGLIKSIKFNKSVILKQKITKDGYLTVILYNNGDPHNFRVHRLVALSFILNPNNYPQINHIDGNKENNCINNLEWCTGSQNMKHSYSTGLSTMPKYPGKAINQFSLDNVFLKEFSSITEASLEVLISGSLISKCCLGKRNKCGGFKWKYK